MFACILMCIWAVVGLHCHSGSGIFDSTAWESHASILAAAALEHFPLVKYLVRCHVLCLALDLIASGSWTLAAGLVFRTAGASRCAMCKYVRVCFTLFPPLAGRSQCGQHARVCIQVTVSSGAAGEAVNRYCCCCCCSNRPDSLNCGWSLGATSLPRAV